MDNEKLIDLIMEGGGVKGIGLVGALSVLNESGYKFRRVAGTSSGAIIASLLAAGYTQAELEQIVRTVNYQQFADEGLIDKLGIPGKTLSFLFEKGIYEGDYIFNFVSGLLAAKGVRTFSDLKLADASSDIKSQYKLVVMATDVTRGKLIRLPWDYAQYGFDPDQQEVASAVRASTAIPFYYEPVRLKDNYIVDGGLLSNFPVWLFEEDRHQHNKITPTLGIKLSAKPEALPPAEVNETDNTFTYALAILKTILDTQDQIHLDDPCTLHRTIFVDTADIMSTNFSISPEQKQTLYENGQKAARKFLSNWDFETFLKMCTK